MSSLVHFEIFLIMSLHVALLWKYRALQLNYRILLFNTLTSVRIYKASVNWDNLDGFECIACLTSHSTIFQFDLDLMTWISLGTNIATRTVYLPLLKLLKQTVHRTSWFIFCTMLEYTGKLTYIHKGRHTNPPTKMCKVVCPSSSKEGKMMFQC